MTEYWDVYDAERKRTGKLHKRGHRMNPGEYNVVCEAWIVSGDRLLVTQRCRYKNYGGLWECTGGAVKAGESSIECMKREIKEEIGIAVSDSELVFRGTKNGATFFIDCYELHKNITLSDLTLQKEEVADAKFVTIDEFERMNRDRMLMPGLYDFMKELGFGFITGDKRIGKD